MLVRPLVVYYQEQKRRDHIDNPGHYFKDGEIIEYLDIAKVDEYSKDDLAEIGKNIREKSVFKSYLRG